MSRPPSSPPSTLPAIVVLGCEGFVLEKCRSAAARAFSSTRSAPLGEAAEVVAHSQPLALVLPRELYDFDPQKFDDLARSVGATLVKLGDDDLSQAAVDALINSAVVVAMRKRAAHRSGEYAIVNDECRVERPFGTRASGVRRVADDLPPVLQRALGDDGDG